MYAKLFQQVVHSSLTEKEPIEVRGVFFMLLALADKEGNILGTDTTIARIINVPPQVFDVALGRLMAPDPDSGSRVEGGRRLIRLEEAPGLKVVNYEKYQSIAREDQRRAYFRQKKREQRARDANGASVQAPVVAREGPAGGEAGVPPLGRTRGTNRPRSVEEVIEAGRMLGLQEPGCRKFWEHYEARAKEDENGNSVWITGSEERYVIVGNWRPLLATWKSNNDERKAKERSGGRTPREAQREEGPVTPAPIFHAGGPITNPNQP